MQNITKQFRNLLFDRLIVCRKELVSLKTVLCFYEHDICRNNSDSDTKYNANFKYLLKNIETLLEKTNTLYKEIDTYHTKKDYGSYAEYLTHIGHFEYRTYKIIQKIGLIQRKAAQINEEIFDQYIPKAAFQRRHSHKALTQFIENYFHSLFSKYNQARENNSKIPYPILVWGYRDKFRVYNSLFDADNNHKIIENAFWYYEIPRLIPALAHEFGHLLQNSRIYQKFQTKLQDELNKKENKALQVFFLQKDKNGHSLLVEEFFGDIIAYNEFGSAYLYTLFFSALPSAFYNLYASYHKDSLQPSFAIPDLQNAEWRQLAILVARIELLLSIEKQRDDMPDTYKAFSSFWGMLFDEQPETLLRSLKTIYSIHRYTQEQFNEFYDTFKQLSSLFQTTQSELDLPETNTNNAINYHDIFNTLWQNHLKNDDLWHHPKFLREEILKSLFKDKTFSYNPYELTFIKYRFDSNDEKEAYTQLTKSIYYKEKPKPIALHTFGIYHQAIIAPKKETIEYASFLENDKANNQDDPQPQTAPYYTYKIPIVKLCQNKGTPNNNQGKFDLILQLMLTHTQADSNNVKQGTDTIIDLLKHYTFTLYKALGPNDFVIHIPNIALDVIYEIKNDFANKIAIFRRSYSVIGFNIEKEDPTKQIDTNNHPILSKVRLKAISSETLKEQIDRYDGNIKNIRKTTGVTDLEIEWNSNITLETIDAFAKSNNKTFIASDIQTFVTKALK